MSAKRVGTERIQRVDRFAVDAFASKAATRSDVYLTTAVLTRAIHALGMVLFAMNETYPLNDKTTLDEIAGFERAPGAFGARVESALAQAGTAAGSLDRAVATIEALVAEVEALAGPEWKARFRLRGR